MSNKRYRFTPFAIILSYICLQNFVLFGAMVAPLTRAIERKESDQFPKHVHELLHLMLGPSLAPLLFAITAFCYYCSLLSLMVY